MTQTTNTFKAHYQMFTVSLVQNASCATVTPLKKYFQIFNHKSGFLRTPILEYSTKQMIK